MTKETEYKFSSFGFIVIDGYFVVAQRARAPYPGCWGPIGGRLDLRLDTSVKSVQMVRFTGKETELSNVDAELERKGYESTRTGLHREICEEILCGKPKEFIDELFIWNVERLGHIYEPDTKKPSIIWKNQVHIGIMGRKDNTPLLLTELSPKADELTGIKRLVDLRPEDGLFPVAKITLEHLRRWFDGLESLYLSGNGIPSDLVPYADRTYQKARWNSPPLRDQIPRFNKLEERVTNLQGALLFYEKMKRS